MLSNVVARQVPASDLEAALIEAVDAAGLDWDELQRTASEIVVFGSRAAGVAGPGSDWDVLCVGQGTSTRTGRIDLVWLDPARIEDQEWLGSELASHIAGYGRWLRGAGDWTAQVSVSPDEIRRKERLVRRRLAGLNRVWADISDPYRLRKAILWRRDLQRLSYLRQNMPVPPTPVLDFEWQQVASKKSALGGLTAAVDAQGTTPEELLALLS